MPRKIEKKRGPNGRPKTKIDWGEVGKYIEAGAPGTEIASMYGFSSKTLYERCLQDHGVGFQQYSQQKKARGDIYLRAKQYSEAMKGDRGMLIWLGKQRLGQRDKHDHEHSGDIQYDIVFFGDCDPKTWAQEQKEKGNG